jgi:hypothetical protein
MIDLNKHYEGFNAAVCEYVRPGLMEGLGFAEAADEALDEIYWEMDVEPIVDDVFNYVAYLLRFEPFGPGSEAFADALKDKAECELYYAFKFARMDLRNRIQNGEVANA